MKNICSFKILVLLILLISLFLCCKKENDTAFPVINVYHPTENEIFAVLDTIVIKAEISHNKKLSNVSIAVVDLNLTPVTGRFNSYPDDYNYTINSNIIIDNIELPSGYYYLHIRASDGSNETNSYTKIYLHEAPYLLEKVFLITKTSLNNLEVSVLNSSLEKTSIYNLNSDFGYTAIDPINKLLYISGKFSSKIYCYDYQNNINKWEAMVQGYVPSPYFDDIKLYNKKIYISIRQKAILAYNSGGTLVYNLPTNTERYPDKIHDHKQYLVSSQYALSNQNSFIELDYLESGGFFQLLQINMNVVKFISKDDNNIYVFANDLNGNAEMRIYDIESNGVWEPYNLVAGKIIDVVEADNNTCFIAYENKILKYTYNPNGATTYISNISPFKLKFDKTEQQLYVLTNDKKILVYNYPNPTLIKQNSVNDSICDLILGYNKP